VRQGKLREDLYYRLNVFPIPVPPLRERLEDVPLLAEHFLSEVNEKEGQVKCFSAAALARMAEYSWPGNVRELRNVVQRVYVMAASDVIGDEWLPTDGPAIATAQPAIGHASTTVTAPVVENVANGTPPASITIPVGTSMAEAESRLILATLRFFNNHKERTAAVLGVSLKTLYNRLKEYSADKSADDRPLRDGESLPPDI
jgi:DNA-binding NtrC family response regulator